MVSMRNTTPYVSCVKGFVLSPLHQWEVVELLRDGVKLEEVRIFSM
jgi:hypothetical protein